MSNSKEVLLKRAQSIGSLNKTFDVLGIKVELRTLKGKANLKVLREVTTPNNEELKNREWEYNILGNSLVAVLLPNENNPDQWDRIAFNTPKEADEFIRGCEYVMVDEIYSLYTRLIDEQKTTLEDKYGVLQQTLAQREYFKKRMAELEALNTEISSEESVQAQSQEAQVQVPATVDEE